ncbi:MAG: glycoside hydrolase family 127 protein [Tannerella sp.]|nr:glycoside hydrolase family 127 protein [Tannerella sp.]
MKSSCFKQKQRLLSLTGCVCAAALVCCSTNKGEPEIAQIPLANIQMQDRFWLPRLQRLDSVTIPHLLHQTDVVVNNLRLTGCYLAGQTDSLPVFLPNQALFETSDLYKSAEAIACALQARPNPALEARMDSIIDMIASSQEADGYMYPFHTCHIPDTASMGTHPYEHLYDSHELYNAGHLYEAAIAYARATGKEKLLRVAEKHARHVQRVFFEGDARYNGGKPAGYVTGHPEIELALCRLYQHTGVSLYLQLAKRLLASRGAGAHVLGAEAYRSQEHLPLVEQHEPAGHAVCATYIYTGMTKADALGGTHDYRQPLDDIWENLMTTRMSITGGLGSVQRVEGFSQPYELPNKDTYNETCASVGNVFWQYDMFLSRHDSRYLDALECSLFNGALSGISLSGDRFFYINTLEADGVEPFSLGSWGRMPWFGCACCPPNISRLIARVSGFFYAHTDCSIYCTLYGSNTATVPLTAGDVNIEQTSDYPFSGTVQIVLKPEKTMRFAVRLRIPTWAEDREFLPGGLYTYTESTGKRWHVKVNGDPCPCPVEKGFAVIERQWQPDDSVTLTLPLQPRYVQARPEVKADSCRLAVVCGPLVYCAETPDNGLVQEYYLPEQTPLQPERITDGLLKDIVMITLTANKLDVAGDVPLKLLPYYAWDNRGDGSMVVWLPQTAAIAGESLPLFVKNRAWLKDIRLSSNDNLSARQALFDGRTPQRSRHANYPRWNSRKQEGIPQQVEFLFNGIHTVESFSVFWISDARTTTLLPASWKLEYLTDGEWKPFPVYMTDSYGLEEDKYNVVRPSSALSCSGIRMKLTPQTGKSVGIAELKVGILSSNQ